MSKTVITYRGHRISCFGDWDESSNVLIAGDWNNGEELEEIWAGDGWPSDKPAPKNWTEVTRHLVDWAEREGHVIYELSAV